jgi:transposase
MLLYVFLHAKNTRAAKIHRELCAVYGQNVMSEGTVRQWCRMFRDGRTHVHDEERSGRPSVVGDGWVQIADALLPTRLSQLGCFAQDIFRKCIRNAENVFGFDFLEQYHRYGGEFLNHIA